MKTMEDFRLQPGDILVTVNKGKDLYSIIKRWALGSPYDHVFMYMGKVGIIVNRKQAKILRFPMLFESNGRGVVIQSLSNQYDREVVVMRLSLEQDRKRISFVLERAIKLASAPQSYYDYYAIIRFVLPRLILKKLGLQMPLKYHRDPLQICSEAVFEVFYGAGLINILPKNVVPLPGDFVVVSPLLLPEWEGQLSEEIL